MPVDSLSPLPRRFPGTGQGGNLLKIGHLAVRRSRRPKAISDVGFGISDLLEQDSYNIASTLSVTARRFPDQPAVVVPAQQGAGGVPQITFLELDELADRLTRGFVQRGIRPGHRLVLMVRPGIEFIAL